MTDWSTRGLWVVIAGGGAGMITGAIIGILIGMGVVWEAVQARTALADTFSSVFGFVLLALAIGFVVGLGAGLVAMLPPLALIRLAEAKQYTGRLFHVAAAGCLGFVLGFIAAVLARLGSAPVTQTALAAVSPAMLVGFGGAVAGEIYWRLARSRHRILPDLG